MPYHHNPKPPDKAVIYARFSPRPDADKCNSIEYQVERCRKYCEARLYKIVSEHADEEMSGKSMDRPGLQDALADACDFRAVLVVYSLDRLARSVVDALNIAERIKRAGAALAMLDIDVNTATPVGECVFTVMAAFSQLARRQTSQRTSHSMRSRMANRKPVGGHAPFGWRQAGGRLEPCRSEQATLRRIVELHEQGATMSAIVRTLDAERLPSRQGEWQVKKIASILRRYDQDGFGLV